MWDTPSAAPAGVLAGHGEGRYGVAFTAADRLTATSRDVRVDYDTRTGERASEPRPTKFPPGAFAVEASDGTARATVNDDQFVRLWDSNNRLQATLYGHLDVVLDAAFSDDRHTLATVSRDGTFLLWDTNPDRVALKICQTLGAELGFEQWHAYLGDLPYQRTCG